MGSGAQVVASINLAIRTYVLPFVRLSSSQNINIQCLITHSLNRMAIWNQKRSINTFLVLLILPQLGLTIRSMFNANGVHYIPEKGCVPISIDTEIYATMYIYTMIVDLIVVVLMAYKLIIQPRRMELECPAMAGGPRSTLVKLLFSDGLAYFIVACVWRLFFHYLDTFKSHYGHLLGSFATLSPWLVTQCSES
jgi:hypothetical protein